MLQLAAHEAPSRQTIGMQFATMALPESCMKQF